MLQLLYMLLIWSVVNNTSAFPCKELQMQSHVKWVNTNGKTFHKITARAITFAIQNILFSNQISCKYISVIWSLPIWCRTLKAYFKGDAKLSLPPPSPKKEGWWNDLPYYNKPLILTFAFMFLTFEYKEWEVDFQQFIVIPCLHVLLKSKDAIRIIPMNNKDHKIYF